MLRTHPIFNFLESVRVQNRPIATGSIRGAAAGAPESDGEGYRSDTSVRPTGPTYTHTSYGQSIDKKGKYLITAEQSDTFLTCYTDAIRRGIDLHMIEFHTDLQCIPPIIDIDGKFPGTIESPQLDQAFIERFVRVYQEGLTTFLDTAIQYSIDGKDVLMSEYGLIAFIFKKANDPVFKPGPTPGSIEYAREGLHIMFPLMECPKTALHMIRAFALKKFTNDIRGDIPFKNSPDNIIDRSVIDKNGWFMYGSKKDGSQPYQWIGVVDHFGSYHPIEFDASGNYVDNGDSLFTTVLPEFIAPGADLPRLFSLRYYERPKLELSTTAFRCIEEDDRLYNMIKARTAASKMGLSSESYNFELIQRLMTMLSDERTDDYTKWVQVIWCLHNIATDVGQDEDRLKQLAVEFSQRSPKYEAGCVDRIWDRARNQGNRISLGTLRYWAHEDSPAQYEAICMSERSRYFEDSLSNTNTDVARYFAYAYQGQFKYCQDKWYIWEGHRWMVDEEKQSIEIRRRLSEFLFKYYVPEIQKVQSEITRIRTQLRMLPDDAGEDKKEMEARIEQVQEKQKSVLKVMESLKTVSFKNNIVSECRELFHDRHFFNKLDRNPDLIGFDNGVYDLKAGTFRDGCPDDYVSMSVGYDYIPYDPANPMIGQVEDFFSKIFVNEDIREFQLTRLSSFIDGHIRHQKIQIWTGSGGNGKSKLQELQRYAMGEYAYKLNIALLTQKRAASNAPNQELVEARNKRWCFLDEPNKKDELNVGLLKEMTGGDELPCRGVFGTKMANFKPMFKLVMLCNNKPRGPADDGGFIRRLELVEFMSKFVDAPDPDNEYQFDKDPELDQKLHMWAPYYMGLLIHRYQTYQANNYQLDVPSIVNQFTSDYIRENDRISQFIAMHLRQGPKTTGPTTDEVYGIFTAWFESEFNGDKVPQKHDVISDMRRKMNLPARGTKFMGWVVSPDGFHEEDEVDDVRTVSTRGASAAAATSHR